MSLVVEMLQLINIYEVRGKIVVAEEHLCYHEIEELGNVLDELGKRVNQIVIDTTEDAQARFRKLGISEYDCKHEHFFAENILFSLQSHIHHKEQ